MDAVQKHREVGNERLEAQDAVGAIDAYRRGLHLLQGSKDQERDEKGSQAIESALRLNMALAMIRLGDFDAAIPQCSWVLACMDRDNVKALYRRGIANKGSGDLVAAEHDLQRVFQLRPNDNSVRTNLYETTEQKKKYRAQFKKEFAVRYQQVFKCELFHGVV